MTNPTVIDGEIELASFGGAVLTLDNDGNLEILAPGNATINGIPIATGPSTATETYITATNEQAGLPNSRRIVGGTGISVDLSLAGLLTLAAAGVPLASLANVATLTLLGNATGGPGAPTALTAAQAKTLLAIAASDVSGLSALATSASGAGLTDATVTLGKIANIGASTILGNNQVGAGPPIALNAGQVKSLLAIAPSDLAAQAAGTVIANLTGGSAAPSAVTLAALTAALIVFTNIAQGVVPASGGGTSNFLRADGSWAIPPGSGGAGASTTVKSAGQALTNAYAASDLIIPIGAGAIRTFHAVLSYITVTPGDFVFAQHTFPAGLTGLIANIYRNSGAPVISDSTLDQTSQLNLVAGAAPRSAVFVYDAIFTATGAGNIGINVKSLAGSGFLEAGSFVTYA